MVDVSIEQTYLPLGKQLAANGNTILFIIRLDERANLFMYIEKKTRDKAIRSFRKFLSSGNNMSEMELIKLWKGLFYCKS